MGLKHKYYVDKTKHRPILNIHSKVTVYVAGKRSVSYLPTDRITVKVIHRGTLLQKKFTEPLFILVKLSLFVNYSSFANILAKSKLRKYFQCTLLLFT